MAPDIVGTAHPLSGRIWMTAATPFGEKIIRECALEIYGDASQTRILYETIACEGAFIVANMARRGAVVGLPHYTLNGRADGIAALHDLG